MPSLKKSLLSFIRRLFGTNALAARFDEVSGQLHNLDIRISRLIEENASQEQVRLIALEATMARSVQVANELLLHRMNILEKEIQLTRQSIHHHLHNIKTIAGISARRKLGHKKACLFLVHHLTAWDSIADIYLAMLNSPEFEPWVAAIDRNFPGETGFNGGQDVSDFLVKRNVTHFKWYGDDSFIYLDVAKNLEPDYIFIQSPWEADLPPAFRPHELQFSRICYTPYFGMTLVEDFRFGEGKDLHYDQPLHRVAFAIFTESEHERMLFAERCSKGSTHVVNTGSAKIFRLFHFRGTVGSWPISNHFGGTRRLRLIWAPHHSVGYDWLAFGVFVSIYQDMLRFAEESKSWLEIVMKPHPALFSNLVATQLLTEEQVSSWLRDWSMLSNCGIVEEGDYGPLFAASDLMMTDGISFLIEYPIATAKPLIFFERPGHLKFNALGDLAVKYANKAHTFSEFVQLMKMANEGRLEYSEEADKEILALCVAGDPPPEERILSFLRS